MPEIHNLTRQAEPFTIQETTDDESSVLFQLLNRPGTRVFALDRAGNQTANGVYNVISEGAKGDGVTDDTVSIQTAINVVSALGGGAVYFPKGTYVVNTALLLPSNVTLIGAGARVSILKPTSLANLGTGIGQLVVLAQSKTNISLRDFGIDLSSMGTPLAGISGGRFFDCTNVHISRVWVRTPMSGFGFIRSSYYSVSFSDFEYVANGSTAGGMIDQWDASNNATICFNNLDGGSTGAGVGMDTGILITGVDSEVSPVLKPVFAYRVFGNTIRRFRSAGVWIDGHRTGLAEGVGAYDIHVLGNTILDATENYGVYAHGCYSCTISHNHIQNIAKAGIWGNGTGGGPRNTVVEGNILDTVNTSGQTTGSAGGAAIYIGGSANRVLIHGNLVRGTSHVRCLEITSTTQNCVVGDNAFPAGTTAPIISNGSASAEISARTNSGVYTPTLTAVANVSASTPRQCRWTREGDVVTVTGRVEVTPTAAASTATQLGISLPVTSNFVDIPTDAAGVATSEFGLVGAIRSDTTNDRVQLQFPATNVSSNFFYFTFQYSVL